MIVLGIILLIVVVILVGLSAWELDKLILFCFVTGLLLIDIDYYNTYGNLNLLGVVGELTLISVFFYFINVYKIMNRKFFNLVKAGEFKEYLDSNNIFSGYNKFIYYFPIFIILMLLLYCVVYYSN